MTDEFTINPAIQEIVDAITVQASRLEIDDAFWEDPQIFANPNNIVLRQMFRYYERNELNQDRKRTYLPLLKFMIFKYCTDRQDREVLGWFFWWVCLYVQDKQYRHELPFQFESWNDPREWLKASLVDKPKEMMIPEGSQMLPPEED